MLLLSIHPRFVDAILRGEKTVELRRRCPRIKGGQALIYATAPRMALAASFRVNSVSRAPLGLLWQSIRETAAVSWREFNAYFEGLDSGVAIEITDVAAFSLPIGLNDLRAAWPGFHPPQGFCYLNAAQVAGLQLLRNLTAA